VRFARRLSLLSLLCGVTLSSGAQAQPDPAADPAVEQPRAGQAHPALWPRARSSGLIDARTEARITRLMARMSLEEKVGQVIQADIESIQPADLRQYPLGSVLAGGDPVPAGGDANAPARAWFEL
jgi:beta-glucosidase